MSRISSNERGFGAVQVVALIVLVCLVGFTGWFVFTKQKHKEVTSFAECVAQGNPIMESYPEQCAADGQVFSNSAQKADVPDNAEPAKAPESDSWLLYEPPGKEYSARLPDGWMLYRYQTSPSIYVNSSADIVYAKGTLATVTQIEHGRDFSIMPFAISYITGEVSAPEGSKVGTITTKQGKSFDKYSHTQTTEPEAIGLPKGAKQYTYRYSGGGVTVDVIHGFAEGDADQTTYIEQVVQLITLP